MKHRGTIKQILLAAGICVAVARAEEVQITAIDRNGTILAVQVGVMTPTISDFFSAVAASPVLAMRSFGAMGKTACTQPLPAGRGKGLGMEVPVDRESPDSHTPGRRA